MAVKNKRWKRVITRDKCPHADRYPAVRPPTCGCVMCNAKWVAKLPPVLGSKKA